VSVGQNALKAGDCLEKIRWSNCCEIVLLKLAVILPSIFFVYPLSVFLVSFIVISGLQSVIQSSSTIIQEVIGEIIWSRKCK
jgi:hypothetical protein